MYGQCKRCRIYGEVSYHHPLPQRWYGNNNFTEPLCKRCHAKADDITFDIDVACDITTRKKGMQFRDIYIRKFCEFMNSLPSC